LGTDITSFLRLDASSLLLGSATSEDARGIVNWMTESEK
jgi:hypothetical protein